MFNDKKKFYISMIFLVTILILSLNCLHASDLDEDLGVQYEIKDVDNIGSDQSFQNMSILEYDYNYDNINYNNLNCSTCSFNSSDVESMYNNSDFNRSHLNESETVLMPFNNTNKSVIKVGNETYAASFYVNDKGNIIAKNIINYNNDSDYILDIVYTNDNTYFDNDYVSFKSLNNNKIYNNSNIILLNNLILQNGNLLSIRNNLSYYGIVLSQNNVVLISNKKNNTFNNILIYENLTNFSYYHGKGNIVVDLNYSSENSVNRNNNQNNLIIDSEKYSTSSIFKIPKLDLHSDLLIENNYYNTIKIHSWTYPSIIATEGNFKSKNSHSLRFYDSYDNYLINKLVTFQINGILYSKTTDEEGKVSLIIDLLNEDYNLSNINCEGNSAIYYSLCENNCENLIDCYSVDDKFHVKLFDNDNNPITNRLVTLDINSILYSKTTNNSGVISLNIDLTYGNYVITVIHPIYNSRIDKIIEIVPVLMGEDITINHKDTASYKVKLVDNQGKPISGEIIEMNIDDVVYEIFTDKNGFACLDINLNPGYYTITSVYQEFSISNQIIVK
ncbi:MAG: hypothetical protein KO202_06615 [Methanobacteriaceae archaeon]|nr:hypothetical protein [Methanobacteriaceae archaeon]